MTLGDLFFGPSEWLVARTSARCRRAVACWSLILTTPTLVVLVVLYPTALWIPDAMLVVTTALSFYALLASETPVEPETSAQEE